MKITITSQGFDKIANKIELASEKAYGKLMVDPKTGSAWAPMGASKTLTGTDLNISRAVHGKAQSRWFEASKAMNKDKWLRSAKKLMGDELK